MQSSQDGSFPYDSFIRVSSRKKRKRKSGVAVTTPSDLLTRAKEELTTDGGWSLSCRELVHEALHDARIKPQKVLCLGLGSPSMSRDARAQLVLLGDLCASLNMNLADVAVYDPVFTDADRELFATLGMRCLDHAQGAEHSVECQTILYMPHCDLELYERVIRANWTAEGVSRLVFVGNRFGHYVESMPELERDSPCLMRLAPLLACRPLPTSHVFPNAFSGLAVQYVSTTPLSLQHDAPPGQAPE